MSLEGMVFPFTEMGKYILSKAAPLKLTELRVLGKEPS